MLCPRFSQLKIQDSMYAALLEDWLRVIPRDRFLFLRFEDYQKDIRGHMETIYEFLDLGQWSLGYLQQLHSADFYYLNNYVKVPVD